MALKTFTSLSKLMAKLEHLIESPSGAVGKPVKQITCKNLALVISEKNYLGQISTTDMLQFLRIQNSFFCVDQTMESFDFEKVALFFILYSNALQEEKTAELFQVLATEVTDKKGARQSRIINDNSGKCERIFGHILYLTCRLAIENVLRDEHRRKQLGKQATETLTDIYSLSNQSMVIDSFISHSLKNGLFPLYDCKQLTLEGFTEILSSPQNQSKLLFPDRLRHAYLFESVFNLADYWKRQILLN